MEIDQYTRGLNFVSIQNVANIAVALLWLTGNLPVHCVPNPPSPCFFFFFFWGGGGGVGGVGEQHRNHTWNPHHRQNIKNLKKKEEKIQVK